jgi:SAM-dependent methyltransferase
LERHRLLWLYASRETDLFRAPKRVLHFAPERCLTRRLRPVTTIEYVSVDLESPSVMLRADITSLPFADATFDVVLCSHVLEHVMDDCTAMAELHRVLRPNGWAIVLTPIEGAETYENWAYTHTPYLRRKHFKQHDHVRIYGRDIVDRLAGAGFDVQTVPYAPTLGAESITRFGLVPDELLFYCRRSISAPMRCTRATLLQ